MLSHPPDISADKLLKISSQISILSLPKYIYMYVYVYIYLHTGDIRLQAISVQKTIYSFISLIVFFYIYIIYLTVAHKYTLKCEH